VLAVQPLECPPFIPEYEACESKNGVGCPSPRLMGTWCEGTVSCGEYVHLPFHAAAGGH
jgi:hypothetical protein